MESSTCMICEAAASLGPSAKPDHCCDECAHLLRWFRGYFGHDPSYGVTWRIGPETTFRELGAESLDWMNWILEVEDKLGVEIPDEDAEKFGTVGQFVRYLRARGASWPSGSEIRLVQEASCIRFRSRVWAEVPQDKQADATPEL